MTTNPPAGFYEVDGELRWWDGDAWTDHVQPVPTPIVEVRGPKTNTGALLLGIVKGFTIAAVLAAIAGIIYVTATGGWSNDSASSSATAGVSKGLGSADASNEVALTRCALSGLGGTVEISVQITNWSAKRSDYAVSLNVLAADGTQIGNGNVLAMDVAPSTTAVVDGLGSAATGTKVARCVITGVQRTASL